MQTQHKMAWGGGWLHNREVRETKLWIVDMGKVERVKAKVIFFKEKKVKKCFTGWLQSLESANTSHPTR